MGTIRGVIGIDFYHFWGVPVAKRLAGGALGPPYRHGARYVDTLAEYAAKANDSKLTEARSVWTRPDFTGSPLLYTAFAVVSSSYTGSLVAFQTLQLSLFLGSFLLLGVLYRLDPFHLTCLALLSVLFYQPLLSDVRVANLGCFQLAAFTGLALLAGAVARAPGFAWRATLGAVFLAALAALTLCKPNVAVISALLAAQLGVRHGGRLFIASALPAAAAAAVLVGIPCVYFGSWTVWREWYEFVYGANAYMLVRPMAYGNFSTALLVSSGLGLDIYAVSAGLMALLGASLLGAVIWSRATQAPVGAATLAGLRRVAGDPQMALAIGIVLTMAGSPLYWLHYYVLMLIPILWLLGAPVSATYVAALAAVAMVTSSGMLALLVGWLGWPAAQPASIALSWLPLWCAILLRIASPDAEGVTARDAGFAKTRFTDARAVVAPPSHRRKK